jgi:NAD(P)-dependent dehydrogenase (short-subunit alcohol dehydrogenase family)
VSKLTDLKDKGAAVLELAVTAPLDKLHTIAKEAAAIHGKIDVVVNNAGKVGLSSVNRPLTFEL